MPSSQLPADAMEWRRFNEIPKINEWEMAEVREKRNGKEIETKLTIMPCDLDGGTEKGAWNQRVSISLRP